MPVRLPCFQLLSTCFTADIERGGIDISATERRLQDTLMDGFFHNVDVEFLQTISCNDSASDVCGAQGGTPWQGIQCVHGFVRKVHFPFSPYGAFNISSLPPTSTSVNLANCEQNCAIETRRLPRCLEYLNVNYQQIHGTIDLTTLPCGMVRFLARNNAIRGPIVLTQLPQTLNTIDFSSNKIKEGDVLFGDVHYPNLKTVKLE